MKTLQIVLTLHLLSRKDAVYPGAEINRSVLVKEEIQHIYYEGMLTFWKSKGVETHF